MSLVLLIGASLFVRSFLNLQNANVGFDTAPLMTMRFYLPGAGYESADAKARRVEDIVRRVEGLPGVQAAFASNFVPLGSGGGGGGNVIVEGKPVEPGRGAGHHVHRRDAASPPDARRRARAAAATSPRPRTRRRPPVAVVNQTMAKQLWPKTPTRSAAGSGSTGDRDARVVHRHRRRRRLPSLPGRQRRSRSSRRPTCRTRSSRP